MGSGCNAQQSSNAGPTNRTCCNPFRCARCGYSYAEDLVNAEPGLQAIIDGWHAIDGATARCDREQAQTALAVLFSESGRTPPVVRWWVCPVAMLVAHDVKMLGLRSAGMMHGPDVIGCSVELAQWLDGGGVGTSELGAPVLMQFVADLVRTPPRRGPGEAACARSQLPSLLTRWAVPLVISRDIEQGIRDVLESSLAARNAAWFSGRSQSVLWPGTAASDLLYWQLAAELGETPQRHPFLDAIVDLARNVHVAVLREHECWVCDRPVSTDYGVIDVLGSIGCIAATYADDTCIAVNAGPKARERDASLRAMFGL